MSSTAPGKAGNRWWRSGQLRPLVALCCLAGATVGAASAATSRPELALQSGHSDSVNAVVFTPDDRYLVSGSHDHSVRLWEVESGIEIRVLGHHTREVLALAMCPDGRCVASGGEDMLVHLWELPSGRLLRTFRGHTQGIEGLAISRDGRLLVSGAGNVPDWDVGRSRDYTVRVWDLASGRQLRRMQGHTQLITSVGLDLGSRRAVSGSLDGTLRIWDLGAGRLQRSIGGFPGKVSAVFSSDGTQLLAASKRAVELLDAASGAHVATLAESPRPYRVAVGGELAAFPSDEGIGLIDLVARRVVATLGSGARTRRGESAQSLAFSRRGDVLAAGFSDGRLVCWDTASRRPTREFHGHTLPLRSVAVANTRGWIATSADAGGAIRIWDVEAGRLDRSLTPRNAINFALAFDRLGNRLAVSGGTHTEEVAPRPIEIWDLASRAMTTAGSFRAKRVEFLKWSPDGRCLGVSGDGRTSVFDWRSRTTLASFEPAARVVEFAQDCRWVATGSRGNDLSYWELPGGRLLHRREDVGWASIVDRARKTLGSLGWQSEFRLLQLATGKWLQLEGHRDYVSDIAFSDGGDQVASASWDGDVRLWDTRTGRSVRTLTTDSGAMSVGYVPGSGEVIAGYRDGAVRIWDAGSGEEIVALIAFRDSDDWLVVAPDGLFDGTALAMQRVAWRLPGDTATVPLEKLFNDFYRPGLLGEIFAGSRPHADLDIATMVRVPGLRRMLKQRLARLESRAGRTLICFDDVPGVAVGVAVGEEDVPARRKGFRVVPDDPSCKYQLELPAGSAAPASHQPARVESETATTPARRQRLAPTASSTLHVLTVGIGAYPASSGLGVLPYAVPSAQAIERYFLHQSDSPAKPFARVRVWQGLHDADATRERIVRALREVAAAAAPEDVLFLYLVGHGLAPEGQEMFSFVPFDGDAGAERLTGLTTAAIAELLGVAAASRFVIAIDTCQAGAAVEALGRVGQAKVRLASLRSSITSGGGHVIAAALPLAYAAQLSSARQSLLASVLLEALGRHRGPTRVGEVVDYVEDRLPILSTQTIGFRQVPLTVSVGADFNLAVN